MPDSRVNVDLRLDRRNDFYAYVFMNDKRLVQKVTEILVNNRYNQCVLEVVDETNKPQRVFTGRDNRDNRDNRDRKGGR